MIQFSDITMHESRGNFAIVRDIMSAERIGGTWMIRTECIVSTSAISCGYLLHVWNDGRVVIKSTDHPTLQDAPDDDLRELSSFVKQQGWTKLELSAELLDNSFDFWLRMYQAGIVDSDTLRQHDESEMNRLAEAYEAEQEIEREEQENAD